MMKMVVLMIFNAISSLKVLFNVVFVSLVW